MNHKLLSCLYILGKHNLPCCIRKPFGEEIAKGVHELDSDTVERLGRVHCICYAPPLKVLLEVRNVATRAILEGAHMHRDGP